MFYDAHVSNYVMTSRANYTARALFLIINSKAKAHRVPLINLDELERPNQPVVA